MNSYQPELTKLDAIDRKVASWISINNPTALKSWIDYTQQQYKRQDVSIDSERLFVEITGLSLAA